MLLQFMSAGTLSLVESRVTSPHSIKSHNLCNSAGNRGHVVGDQMYLGILSCRQQAQRAYSKNLRLYR